MLGHFCEPCGAMGRVHRCAGPVCPCFKCPGCEKRYLHKSKLFKHQKYDCGKQLSWEQLQKLDELMQKRSELMQLTPGELQRRYNRLGEQQVTGAPEEQQRSAAVFNCPQDLMNIPRRVAPAFAENGEAVATAEAATVSGSAESLPASTSHASNLSKITDPSPKVLPNISSCHMDDPHSRLGRGKYVRVKDKEPKIHGKVVVAFATNNSHVLQCSACGKYRKGMKIHITTKHKAEMVVVHKTVEQEKEFKSFVDPQELEAEIEEQVIRSMDEAQAEPTLVKEEPTELKMSIPRLILPKGAKLGIQEVPTRPPLLNKTIVAENPVALATSVIPPASLSGVYLPASTSITTNPSYAADPLPKVMPNFSSCYSNDPPPKLGRGKHIRVKDKGPKTHRRVVVAFATNNSHVLQCSACGKYRKGMKIHITTKHKAEMVVVQKTAEQERDIKRILGSQYLETMYEEKYVGHMDGAQMASRMSLVKQEPMDPFPGVILPEEDRIHEQEVPTRPIMVNEPIVAIKEEPVELVEPVVIKEEPMGPDDVLDEDDPLKEDLIYLESEDLIGLKGLEDGGTTTTSNIPHKELVLSNFYRPILMRPLSPIRLSPLKPMKPAEGQIRCRVSQDLVTKHLHAKKDQERKLRPTKKEMKDC